jgi:3-oxoacid CoA-transferase
MSNYQGEYIVLPQDHIIFGAGSLSRLAEEVKRLGGQRVLLITGQSLATKTDIVERVKTALGELYAGTFSSIRQHSPESDIAEAAAQVRALKADLLVSVGGGSPIDAAKVVGRMLKPELGRMLPHIAIPTTLSAAEISQLAGVTVMQEGVPVKVGYGEPELVPTSALLDSSMTLATPMQLWLSSGIRALDHAVETLYAPGLHPANDVLALEAIRLLFEYLPLCNVQPEDLEIRTQLQIAAWLSFFGPFNTRMGLSHNLGRRIGATYNVPHGITSCITLPHVMRVLAPQNAPALARIAKTLELPEASGDALKAALAAADAVEKLIGSLGLPQRLNEVGITEADLPAIAGGTAAVWGSQQAEAEEALRRML